MTCQEGILSGVSSDCWPRMWMDSECAAGTTISLSSSIWLSYSMPATCQSHRNYNGASSANWTLVRTTRIKNMVEDAMRTYKQFLTAAHWEDTEEQRTRTYTSLVLCGKLWAAVRWIMDRDRGGVYQLGYICSKTGVVVLEVRHKNRPEAHPDRLHG